MNAVSNAQLWHRRAGPSQQKELGTHAAARRQRHHLRRHHSGLRCLRRWERPSAISSKKPQHAGITRPFPLCFGNLMGAFTPEAYEGFKYASKITDQFTRWTVVYLLENKSCTFNTFRLFVTLTVIPCGGRVIRWRADEEEEYTSEAFKQYYLETGITQEFGATNTPEQNDVSERVGRTLRRMIRCLLVDSGLPPKLAGSSCSLRLTSATVCHTPRLT